MIIVYNISRSKNKTKICQSFRCTHLFYNTPSRPSDFYWINRAQHQHLREKKSIVLPNRRKRTLNTMHADMS